MARSLLALLFFAISASGKEILISDWLTPQRSDTKYYPDMDAAVGDTITFVWPGMLGRSWLATERVR